MNMRTKKHELIEYHKKIQALHKKKYSSVDIAKMLGKDHSTILHHLRRMKFKLSEEHEKEANFKNTIKELEASIKYPKVAPPDLTSYEMNKNKEKLNKGKASYADYLKEEKMRKARCKEKQNETIT